MSLEHRLARLEASPPAARQPDSPEARIDAGKASISDYATFYSDFIAEQQDEFLGLAPFMVAVTHSTIRHRNTPNFALAYPPDRPLPEEMQEDFDDLVRHMDFDIEDALRRGWNRTTPDEYRREDAWQKAGYAAVLMAFGGFDGMALRRRIWTVEDNHWILSPEVWTSANRHRESLYGGGHFHDIPGLFAAWQDGHIGDADDRYAHVTVTEVAHFIGMPTLPALDSTMVKSGQIRSPRACPKSLPETEISTSIARVPRRIAPGQTP